MSSELFRALTGAATRYDGARPSTGAVSHVPDAGGLEGRVQPRPISDDVEVVPPRVTKSMLGPSIPKPLGQYRTKDAE